MRTRSRWGRSSRPGPCTTWAASRWRSRAPPPRARDHSPGEAPGPPCRAAAAARLGAGPTLQPAAAARSLARLRERATEQALALQVRAVLPVARALVVCGRRRSSSCVVLVRCAACRPKAFPKRLALCAGARVGRRLLGCPHGPAKGITTWLASPPSLQRLRLCGPSVACVRCTVLQR